MHRGEKFRAAVATACLAVAVGTVDATADTPEFVYLEPDKINYQSRPGSGLKQALLVGNPSEPGLYVLRVEFAPGVTSPPHSHDQARYITVISGTWYFGMGPTGKCENTVPLPAGSFAVHPAGAVHFDGSCDSEPVLVEIRGLGPVVTRGLSDTQKEHGDR